MKTQQCVHIARHPYPTDKVSRNKVDVLEKASRRKKFTTFHLHWKNEIILKSSPFIKTFILLFPKKIFSKTVKETINIP